VGKSQAYAGAGDLTLGVGLPQSGMGGHDMLWPAMTKDQLELIRVVIDRANNVARDLDMWIETIEEAPDYVKIVALNDDDETTVEAFIRVLGDYNYEDRRTEDEGSKTIENTLLGVFLDGDNQETRWRIIDARGSSLFAMLYV